MLTNIRKDDAVALSPEDLIASAVWVGMTRGESARDIAKVALSYLGKHGYEVQRTETPSV